MTDFAPDDILHAWLVAAYRGGGPTVDRIKAVLAKHQVALPAGIIMVIPERGTQLDPARFARPHIALSRHAGQIAIIASGRDAAAIRKEVLALRIPVTELFPLADAAQAVEQLRAALIASRKLDLADLFSRHLATASYDAELHLRSRALQALRHGDADWPEHLRLWSETMLVRHFPRLNGVRRKYIDFLCLMMRDYDFGWGSDWAFIRSLRLVQECYRMAWQSDHFIGIVKGFLSYISGRASDIMITAESRDNFKGTVRKAVEFMREHYLEPIGLAEVAGALGVSGPYLSRTFHRETQVTLTEFLQKIRIEHARELLSTSDASIISISLSCGYQSSKHFHRTFRSHTGMTPKAFRESRRF
jgi:AraC-like DNA-binding protein